MESYMKLHFSKIPDTLIRIMMDYSPLSKKIQVKEQKLEPKQRKGFTIVEWGGRRVEMQDRFDECFRFEGVKMEQRNQRNVSFFLK